MIGYLKGIVLDSSKDNVLINVNNVGYEVLNPYPYMFKIKDEIELFIYTHVREDQFILFGFKTKYEKEVFLKLIQVKGVGPKTALGIMAAVDSEKLIEAIDTENVNYLKKLPGIGAKSANQIILDLKGKVAMPNLFTLLPNELEDANEALLALGYKDSEVKKVMKVLAKENLTTEEYVKKGLQLLLK